MQITLKAARINAGYTQREAAKIMGISKEALGHWERGKSFPNALQIKTIEKTYGIHYDNIIFLPDNTL